MLEKWWGSFRLDQYGGCHRQHIADTNLFTEAEKETSGSQRRHLHQDQLGRRSPCPWSDRKGRELFSNIHTKKLLLINLNLLYCTHCLCAVLFSF